MNNIITLNGVIEKGKIKEGLMKLFNINEDFNGVNGNEYVSEEALKDGYNSDL